MAINIPNKTEKLCSYLRDSFRILAWQNYKATSKIPESMNLKEFYVQCFMPEWEEHSIHDMNLKELLEFAEELGYGQAELLKIRNDYYISRQAYKQKDDNQPAVTSGIHESPF